MQNRFLFFIVAIFSISCFAYTQVPGDQFLGLGFDLTTGSLMPQTDAELFSSFNKPRVIDWSDINIDTTRVFNQTNVTVDEYKTGSEKSKNKQYKHKKGINLGFFSAKASVSYKNIMKETSTFYARSYLAEAVYGVGYVSILKGTLNKNFLYDIEQLPSVYNDTTKETFFRFINKYGTHVIEGCQLGGRLSMNLFMSRDSFTYLHEEQIDTSVSIKLFFFAKASASFSESDRNFQALNTVQTKSTYYGYGGDTSLINDMEAWANSLNVIPMPVSLDIGGWIGYLPDELEKKQEIINAMSDYFLSSLTTDRTLTVDASDQTTAIYAATFGPFNFSNAASTTTQFAIGSDPFLNPPLPEYESIVLSEKKPDPALADLLSVVPGVDTLLSNPVSYSSFYSGAGLTLWQPVCRESYTALSMVATSTNVMPKRSQFTCVADRCIAPCDKIAMGNFNGVTIWRKTAYNASDDLTMGFGATYNGVNNDRPWCIQRICRDGITNVVSLTPDITTIVTTANMSCTDDGTCVNTDPAVSALIPSSTNTQLVVGLSVGLTVGLCVLALIAIIIAYVVYQKRRHRPLVPEKVTAKFSNFKVGKKVVALYEKDGNYYHGVIDSVDHSQSRVLVRWTDLDGSRDWISKENVNVED